MYIILFVYKHVNNGDADHEYNHVVYKNYNYIYMYQYSKWKFTGPNQILEYIFYIHYIIHVPLYI